MSSIPPHFNFAKAIWHRVTCWSNRLHDSLCIPLSIFFGTQIFHLPNLRPLHSNFLFVTSRLKKTLFFSFPKKILFLSRTQYFCFNVSSNESPHFAIRIVLVASTSAGESLWIGHCRFPLCSESVTFSLSLFQRTSLVLDR